MKNIIIFFILITNTINSRANISLPNAIGDNMVLQRNSEVSIWGWAKPGENVVVKTSWNNSEYSVKTNNQAYWIVKVKTTEGGGPYTIAIKENKEIILNNILLGEVWLCSGQSNMEMPAAWGITNGEQEVLNSNYPNIRFFNVPKLAANEPQQNVIGNWTTCTPDAMINFSALAYFYAQKLQKELNVPVGLILSSWGGIPAEPFIPKEAVEINPLTNFEAKKLRASQWWPTSAGSAYNAMIHPFLDYKIAGVIWYQGESNCGSTHYDETFATLIRSWRMLWKYDFPFYYAQIAPYKYENNTFDAGIIRDSQRKVLNQLENVGMALTTDISTIDDIHPKDKKTIGIRLANLALKKTYKKNNDLVDGPLYKSIEFIKNKIIVHFDNAEGLKFKNQNSTQFEIAGDDNVYVFANAKIKSNTIVLGADKILNPKKVRFSYKNTNQSDVVNAANLPASTFASE